MYDLNLISGRDGQSHEVIIHFHFHAASNTPYVPLLSWRKAQECVPWNIILLLGGGFAMAKGCEVLHYQRFAI